MHERCVCVYVCVCFWKEKAESCSRVTGDCERD